MPVCETNKVNQRRRLTLLATPVQAWPAICEIWLGWSTVPVLAVAKDRDKGELQLQLRTDRRKIFLSGHLPVVCLDVFLPFSK